MYSPRINLPLAFGLLLSVLLLLPAVAFSQHGEGGVIAGRIRGAESGEPLASANVYLSYTLLGAATAEDGTFRIQGVPIGVYDLVVSLLGYERRVLNVMMAGADSQYYELALEAKVLESEEVEVVASQPEEWRENLSRFRRAFIGDTPNAGECLILNPEVLDFAYDPSTGILTAATDSIVRIENRALGYAVALLLAKFSWSTERDVGEYLMYPRFRRLESEDPTLKARWEEGRRRAYEGSLPHFLRSLLEGTTASENFHIYAGRREKLIAGMGHMVDPQELLARGGEESPFRKISFPRELKVEYRKNFKTEVSFISLRGAPALLDPYGNLVNPLSMLVSGSWAGYRVADLLPTQ